MNFGNDFTTIIAVGAILGGIFGIVAKFWGTLKIIYSKCFSMIISTVHLDGEETSRIVLSWMLKNLKRSSTQDRSFGSKFEYLKNGKYGLVSYEFFGKNMMLFWKKWLPLIYHSYSKPESEKVSINFYNKGEEKVIKLYFIRGTFNIQKIITDSSNERNNLAWSVEEKEGPKRFFIKSVPDPKEDKYAPKTSGTTLNWYNQGIYELLNFHTDDLGKQSKNFCSLGNLVFPPVIQEILQEAIQWRQSKEWYNEKKIPWKRGWLLHGVPGCGKTAIVRAISQYLDMPLYVFSLGELENSDLQKSWEEMQANAPCFALFEDFDNVFHGRNNVYNKPQLIDLLAPNPGNIQQENNTSAIKSGKLTFDALLNCLDGVDKNEGIFTVITTNHVEHIDCAIGRPEKGKDGKINFTSTRPGRIDKAVELGYMRNQEKLVLAERILNDSPEGLLEIKKFIRDNPEVNHTPAQWQEKCSQIVLREYWASKNSSEIKIVEEAA